MRRKLRKRRAKSGPGESGSIGLTAVESEPESVHGLRSLCIKSDFIAAKELLQLNAVCIVGLRVNVPDERPRGPLRSHERIFAAHDIDIAVPQQPVIAVLR